MKQKHERGATFMEFIFASCLILFTAYATLEITHILTFKNKLHTVAVDISQQVVHQHLYLKRLYETQGETETVEWLSDQIHAQSQIYFAAIEHTVVTPGFRIKPVIVMTPDNNKEAGLYLQVSACYSFLFAGSLSDMDDDVSDKLFNKENLPHIPLANPITKAPTEKNCFEEFSFQPNPQMTLYERTYTPWPANTALYEMGIPEGNVVKGVSPTGRNVAFIFDLTMSEVFHREVDRSHLQVKALELSNKGYLPNSKARVESKIEDSRTQYNEIHLDKGVQ